MGVGTIRIFVGEVGGGDTWNDAMIISLVLDGNENLDGSSCTVLCFQSITGSKDSKKFMPRMRSHVGKIGSTIADMFQTIEFNSILNIAMECVVELSSL
jgi:hypothetical protein